MDSDDDLLVGVPDGDDAMVTADDEALFAGQTPQAAADDTVEMEEEAARAAARQRQLQHERDEETAADAEAEAEAAGVEAETRAEAPEAAVAPPHQVPHPPAAPIHDEGVRVLLDLTRGGRHVRAGVLVPPF